MRILTTICLLIPVLGSAQLVVNPETKLFTYEQTSQVDSMKAADLFAKAKEWMVLKNAKISGEVSPSMIKASFQTTCPGPAGKLDCTVDITVRSKDGAVKVTFDRFVYQTGMGPSPVEDQFVDPAAAIVKKKKIPVGLEAMGAELAASLLKHLKAKRDF